MKAKMQHIAAIFLAVLLLFSSAGVPVYEHFCRSSNFYEISVLPITKCETKPVANHACCKPTPKTCCSGKPAAQGQEVEKPCCSYDANYLALDTDLPATGSLKQKLPLPEFAAPALLPACHTAALLFSGNSAAARVALLKTAPRIANTANPGCVANISLLKSCPANR